MKIWQVYSRLTTRLVSVTPRSLAFAFELKTPWEACTHQAELPLLSFVRRAKVNVSVEVAQPASCLSGGPTLGFELSQLKAWYRQAKLEQEEQRRGRELTTVEKNAVIRSNPVPVCLRAIGH